MFSIEKWQFMWDVVTEEFYMAVWETMYVTLLSTFLAVLIGLPLGVLLVIGDKNGIRPLPKVLIGFVNTLINFLRSLPFLILMIVVLPLSRLIVGTTVGTEATIVPLTVAAFSFIARLIEGSLREVDKGVIEAAQSMGASTFQIVRKVLLPEALPSIVNNITLAVTTVLGYTAMSGMLGGGGLGKIAINYGYYRYQYLVMYMAVIVLVLLVVAIQYLGDRFVNIIDKRKQ